MNRGKHRNLLTFESLERAGEWCVRLKGNLVQGAGAILSDAVKGRSGHVVIDMDAVTLISSIGMREWVGWIDRTGTTLRITLERCHPHVITMGNMIPPFFSGIEIRSLYANFICPNCRQDSSVLLRVGESVSLDGDVAAQRCRACGSTLNADYSPEDYFAFLGRDQRRATAASE